MGAEWVIQPRWDYVEQFSEGLAAVRVGEKWGCIDKKGDWVAKTFWRAPAPPVPPDPSRSSR